MRTAFPTETNQACTEAHTHGLIEGGADQSPVPTDAWASPGVAEVWFRAMGADAQITVVGGSAHLVPMAMRRIAALEARWSRFLPNSDLSQMNAQAGQWVRVSDDLALAIGHAREAWALSGGAFDPTALAAVQAAGYNQSFERLGGAAHDAEPSEPDDTPRSGRARSFVGCNGIELRAFTDVDPQGGPNDVMARIPAESGIDLGGIGKGLAADLVVGELMAAGAHGALVNLGGDLRVEGHSPTGLGWRIDIDHPHQRQPIASLLLHSGGIATSTTLKRRWRTSGGAVAHHLIDPATGLPSTSDIELAVVVSGAAWRAEVLAKASLLRGSGRCFDLIDEHIDAALVVDANGRIETTPNLGGFVAGTLPTALPHSDVANERESS